MRLMQVLLMIAALVSLSACSNVGLRVLSSEGEGPDEFRITPGLPLEAPESFETLPTPTPGGANLTDQNPIADRTLALGGRPQADGGAVPASEAAIVNHASRFGRDGAIREQLAELDADFRRRKSRFIRIRLRPIDRYKEVYSDQALNPQTETRRWRRAGLGTASSPPS